MAPEILLRWPRRPITILCGPGHNGGVGFETARLLAEADWPVRLAQLGSRDDRKASSIHNAEMWQGEMKLMFPAVVEKAEPVVDAIYGSGPHRPFEAETLETLCAAEI